MTECIPEFIKNTLFIFDILANIPATRKMSQSHKLIIAKYVNIFKIINHSWQVPHVFILTYTYENPQKYWCFLPSIEIMGQFMEYRYPKI